MVVGCEKSKHYKYPTPPGDVPFLNCYQLLCRDKNQSLPKVDLKLLYSIHVVQWPGLMLRLTWSAVFHSCGSLAWVDALTDDKLIVTAPQCCAGVFAMVGCGHGGSGVVFRSKHRNRTMGRARPARFHHGHRHKERGLRQLAVASFLWWFSALN